MKEYVELNWLVCFLNFMEVVNQINPSCVDKAAPKVVKGLIYLVILEFKLHE